VLLVSQFHFVYRYKRTTLWHALLFGIYGNIAIMLCQPCHPYLQLV